ncbi:MAG: MltA domain-containing protein [Desulfovibrionaceae bacterium]
MTRHPVLRMGASAGAAPFALALLAALAVLLAAGCAKLNLPSAAPAREQGPSLAEQARFYSFSDRDSVAESRRIDIRSQGLHSWMELADGLAVSLAYVGRKPQNELAVSRAGVVVTWGQLRRSLEELKALLPKLDRRPELLAERFAWYELRPSAAMTGYYTPEIEASLTRRPGYDWPIYARPPDLRVQALGGGRQPRVYRIDKGRACAYYSRADVDLGGVLAGRGLELAWARNPVDVYYLQQEGCGRLRLPDGTVRDVVFAASNGLEFESVSRILARRGLLAPGRLGQKDVYAAYARDPAGVRRAMAENPRYVFFSLADRASIGSLGAPLSPMVSVATDPAVLPLGALFVVQARIPGPGGEGVRDMRGVVLAQDAGRAIRGAELDFYTGLGHDAALVGSGISARARVWLLLSRGAVGK